MRPSDKSQTRLERIRRVAFQWAHHSTDEAMEPGGLPGRNVQAPPGTGEALWTQD